MKLREPSLWRQSPGGRLYDPMKNENIDDLYRRYQEWYYKVDGYDERVPCELLMFLAHVEAVEKRKRKWTFRRG